jgi:hypothetical protein
MIAEADKPLFVSKKGRVFAEKTIFIGDIACFSWVTI